jgi:hypothetical protein
MSQSDRLSRSLLFLGYSATLVIFLARKHLNTCFSCFLNLRGSCQAAVSPFNQTSLLINILSVTHTNMDTEQSRTPAPDWSKKEGESDVVWESRVRAEEDAFLAAYKVNYAKVGNEDMQQRLLRIRDEETTLWAAIDEIEGNLIDFGLSSGQNLRFVLMANKALEAQTQARKAAQLQGLPSFTPSQQEIPRHPVATTLRGLQEGAKFGEYYARNISERLAKAWSQGEHRPTFRKLEAGEDDYPLWEQRQNQLTPTGVTIQGALDSFEGCFDTLETLRKLLTESPDAKGATQIYDAYDDVCIKLETFRETLVR